MPSSGPWANPHVASTDNYSVFHTEALKFFKNELSSYEQSEILGYTELWFLGLEAEKLHVTPEKFSKTSFDDEHGSYIKVMGKYVVVTPGAWGSGTGSSLERKKKVWFFFFFFEITFGDDTSQSRHPEGF